MGFCILVGLADVGDLFLLIISRYKQHAHQHSHEDSSSHEPAKRVIYAYFMKIIGILGLRKFPHFPREAFLKL